MKTVESNNESDAIVSSLPREKWCINEPLYKFHGYWFPKAYLESTKRFLQHFKPNPKDVILVSFPKTGTTWLKALLHSITHRSHHHHNTLILNHPHLLVPSLETLIYLQETNTDKNPNHKEGRILATHLPYEILGDVVDSSGCKIVYVTRNPKDTLISLWHFVQTSEMFQKDPWELGFAVDQFLKGCVPFGPYYEHVLGYRQECLKNPKKVLFLTYEELKEDTKTHVVRIGEFLECPFKEEVEVDKIVETCTFERLSKHEVNKSSDLPDGFPLPYSSFFRKGEVGDYRNHLNGFMVGEIDGVTRDKFYEVGFEYGI